mgnify:CR=1 FL=1
MKETVHLFHINDLHSHFEHWERIVKYMNEQQKAYEEAGDIVYKLDIGDHVDRFHPYTEGTMGKGNVLLLNEAGIDGATIGNNEGITLPHQALDSLYEDAKFPITVANLYKKDGSRPTWATPYYIRVTPEGRRIAFFGVTAPFTELYDLLGWSVTDPFAEIERIVNELKEVADIIILLSHLGLPSDEIIASKFPEISLILGGHTHHILHSGKKINNTLLCCAGKYGMFVGHVELTIDDDGNLSTKASLKDMRVDGFSKKEQELEANLYRTGEASLNEEILTLKQPLKTDWFHSSELPDLLCQGLKEWCHADCAIINAGLLLDGLEARIVTKYDIHRICPHPINPCIVTINGEKLNEILHITRKPEWPHLQVKGLGFRGKVMGSFVYDGLQLIDTENDSYWLINGVKISPREVYRVAIPDMYTFGGLFPEIRKIKNKTYLMPEFIRDILAWKLAKQKS